MPIDNRRQPGRKPPPPKASTSKSSITLNDIATQIMRENNQLDLKDIINQEISVDSLLEFSKNKEKVKSSSRGGVKKKATKGIPGNKKQEGFFVSFLNELFPGLKIKTENLKKLKSETGNIKNKVSSLFNKKPNTDQSVSKPTSNLKNDDTVDIQNVSGISEEKILNSIEEIKDKVDDVSDEVENISNEFDTQNEVLKRGIDGIQDNLSIGIQNIDDRLNVKVADITEKLTSISQRISAKDITIGKKENKQTYRYDPLAPQGKQVREYLASGKVGGFANKGDANRVLTAAAYLGSENLTKKSIETPEKTEASEPVEQEKPKLKTDKKPKKTNTDERVFKKELKKIDKILKIVREIQKTLKSKDKKDKKKPDKKQEENIIESFLGELFPGIKQLRQKAKKSQKEDYYELKKKFDEKDKEEYDENMRDGAQEGEQDESGDDGDIFIFNRGKKTGKPSKPGKFGKTKFGRKLRALKRLAGRKLGGLGRAATAAEGAAGASTAARGVGAIATAARGLATAATLGRGALIAGGVAAAGYGAYKLKELFGGKSEEGGGEAGRGETGGDKVKEATNFFISKGWTPAQAAGIVGNLMVESGNFSEDVISGERKGDGGQAVGIAQWHPPRQEIFEKQFGKPLAGSSFTEQLEFIQYELSNTEKTAAEALREAQDPETAAIIFDKKYERSAGSSVKERVDNANSVFASLGGTGEEGKTDKEEKVASKGTEDSAPKTSSSGSQPSGVPSSASITPSMAAAGDTSTGGNSGPSAASLAPMQKDDGGDGGGDGDMNLDELLNIVTMLTGSKGAKGTKGIEGLLEQLMGLKKSMGGMKDLKGLSKIFGNLKDIKGLGELGNLGKLGNLGELAGAAEGVTGLAGAAEGVTGLAGAAEGAAGLAGAAEGAAGLAGVAEGAAGLAGAAEGAAGLAAAAGPAAALLAAGAAGYGAGTLIYDAYGENIGGAIDSITGLDKEAEQATKGVSASELRAKANEKLKGTGYEQIGAGKYKDSSGNIVTADQLPQNVKQKLNFADSITPAKQEQQAEQQTTPTQQATAAPPASQTVSQTVTPTAQTGNDVAQTVTPQPQAASVSPTMGEHKDEILEDIENKLNMIQSQIASIPAQAAASAPPPPPPIMGGGSNPLIIIKLTNDETSISTYNASIFDHPVIHPGLFKM